MKIAWSGVAGVLLLLVGLQAGAAAPQLEMEEFRVASSDPGLTLYVRNKHPKGMTGFAGERIVLFVHGSTYPAETSFDLALGGLSWMDYIARQGYDVYLVDVRGYGKSSRPAAMAEPPANNEPIVRTETAMLDVGAAVDFIRQRRHVEKINLLGWSWGTTIMGWYTGQHNDKVNKLVLYAPRWLAGSASIMDNGGKLGAYRTVTRDKARARWLSGVPQAQQAALLPAAWFEAWADATFASDPEGQRQNPPVLRAPNGTVQDTREFWTAGKPMYDPGTIRVPTLLVHADWDIELPNAMLYSYFDKLASTPYRRMVQIGEGTHSVMMEKNRMQLFEAVQHFLDEKFTPGQ
ncbi:MAG: alpha/beta fold hydrolase [Pseudomonadota bacterium]